MPTNRGWALLGAGGALVLLWYVFGDEELLLAGIFLSLSVTVAVGYVRLHGPEIELSRRLASTTVSDGDTTTVTILVRNRSGHVIRNIHLEDQVERLGLATFELARLDPTSTATATYRVTCRPRGVYLVGPLVAAVGDPLGLAGMEAAPGPVDRLVVYPRVERLDGIPIVRGQDPAQSASRPEHSQHGGEDFYTLREYQRGDDLRRVHWPSSARTQELMIRQLETPWQSRALVLLDVRPSVYESNAAFEKAVSGAASVVTHFVGSGFRADLWAGDPQTIDASRYAAAMERLALVQPNPDIDVEAVATRLRQKGGGGALVIVSGTADRALLGVQRLLAPEFPTTVLMGASSTTPQTLVGFHRLGVTTVSIEPDEDWAGEWSKAMRSSWTAVSAS